MYPTPEALPAARPLQDLRGGRGREERHSDKRLSVERFEPTASQSRVSVYIYIYIYIYIHIYLSI